MSTFTHRHTQGWESNSGPRALRAALLTSEPALRLLTQLFSRGNKTLTFSGYFRNYAFLYIFILILFHTGVLPECISVYHVHA